MRYHHLFFILLALIWPLPPALAADNSLTSPDALLAKASQTITNINTAQLQKMLAASPGLRLIDVRTQREIWLRKGTINTPGNRIVPRGWLEFRIGELTTNKDTPIVVYCGVNKRSPLAARTLMRMGYTHVYNYADGFFAWQKAGLPVDIPDREMKSILYRLPQKVTDGVYSAIGATQPGTYENAGHNNNLSFIITSDGVVVMNAGGSYLLAAALHDEIRKLTDQPVRYVVLENGQSHAAMGSGYWKEQGAIIIAHKDTAHELKEHGEAILARTWRRLLDKAHRTRLVLPDRTFDDRLVLTLGGQRIELWHPGPAHSPGDIMLWMPQKRLVITGDVAFHQRLLPVMEHTDTAGWIKTWDKLEALKPKIVIPGHGDPTTLPEVRKYTRDYLVYMRTQIAKLIENGGELGDAYKIDQSAYQHLDTFRFLARQNAGRIFRAMEFE